MIHQKKIVTAGKKIEEASKVLLLLHGRGASAADILSLAPYLKVENYALLAPQATQHTWYPYSFLNPIDQNEPWLSSALSLLGEIVEDIEKQGVKKEAIYFLGFSQGACLVLEYVARNAQKWGGVAAFTGGLIGEQLMPERYAGDFKGTPIFIGTSDPDPHVPVQRVHASAQVLQNLNARVTEKVYPHMGHTITGEEIEWANTLIFHPSETEIRN